MAFNLGAFGQGFAQGMNSGANMMMMRERIKDARARRAQAAEEEAGNKNFLNDFKATIRGLDSSEAGLNPAARGVGAGDVGPQVMSDDGQFRPVGQGFLTDGMAGRDELLGRQNLSGAEMFGNMNDTIKAGLEQLDTRMADLRGRMRGGLASYVENADTFPQYAYQSAMEEPYGIRETAAHKLALKFYGKSTGDPAVEITIDKNGNLWRWVPNEGTDEQGRPLAPAHFVTPRAEVEKMLGDTGNGYKWDAFSKRYLSPDKFATSQTAWVQERGAGYFEGLSANEIRADYKSWLANKQQEIRLARAQGTANARTEIEEQKRKIAQSHYATLLDPNAPVEQKNNATSWLLANRYPVYGGQSGAAGNAQLSKKDIGERLEAAKNAVEALDIQGVAIDPETYEVTVDDKSVTQDQLNKINSAVANLEYWKNELAKYNDNLASSRIGEPGAAPAASDGAAPKADWTKYERGGNKPGSMGAAGGRPPKTQERKRAEQAEKDNAAMTSAQKKHH